jgi:hypothetical protein
VETGPKAKVWVFHLVKPLQRFSPGFNPNPELLLTLFTNPLVATMFATLGNPPLVLAMGPGNLPEVRILANSMVWLGLVWFSLIPDSAKNPIHYVLVGLLSRLDINPPFFAQGGTGPQFHITVRTTLAVIWL